MSALKALMGSSADSPGSQLTLCSTDPANFRTNLQAHVNTMASLGFNADALGLLAKRQIRLLLGTPDELAAQFDMLRSFFDPWGDELANDTSCSKITPRCMPAVVQDSMHVLEHPATTSKLGPISLLHKAMLSGLSSLWQYTPERLKEQMRTLVAAGLCTTMEDARYESMHRTQLLHSHTLAWYLGRKAAVLEVGGNMDDVRTACCRTHSLRVTLARLLLYKRARCAASYISASTPGKSPRPLCRFTLPIGPTTMPRCRGAVSIRTAMGAPADRLASIGADGAQGGRVQTFNEFLASEAIDAELRMWHNRIDGQVQLELRCRREQLAPGAIAVHA